MRKFSGRGSQTNHGDTPCHRAAAATRRKGLTRLCVKVKLVPRHLNRLGVSPERSYSHRHQLITQTSRLISPVKSDGQAYVLAQAYTLLTRYRITFSVPFLCFSLHLLHSVASASGRVSETKRKKITEGIQIRDVAARQSNFIRRMHSDHEITLLSFFKKFRINLFLFFLPKCRLDAEMPFSFFIGKYFSGSILP